MFTVSGFSRRLQTMPCTRRTKGREKQKVLVASWQENTGQAKASDQRKNVVPIFPKVIRTGKARLTGSEFRGTKPVRSQRNSWTTAAQKAKRNGTSKFQRGRGGRICCSTAAKKKTNGKHRTKGGKKKKKDSRQKRQSPPPGEGRVVQY